jgi:hypothetical protein
VGRGRGAEGGSLEVLELPGLDHSLQMDGDPLASLDVLRGVTERIGLFLGRIALAKSSTEGMVRG